MRVHIAGHGSTGNPNIHPPHGSAAAPVSYEEVAAGLSAKGLPKRLMGTIVCYVCLSALGSPSFAKLLAREMWSSGYKLCPVMGHKRSMQPGYVTGLGRKYRHRQVTLSDGTAVKSSAAQERFFGWM
ncbi:MAG: hypothetical protein ACI9KK_003129 [Ascidiaceihabitans sp.]|jgi:hypothetical protein